MGVQEGDILLSEFHGVIGVLHFLSMSLAIGVGKGILFQRYDCIADKVTSRYIYIYKFKFVPSSSKTRGA